MTSVVKNIKSILPGFIVALIVALSSMFLAKFVPALGAAPIAIFLGMFVGNIFLNQKVFQRGYKFSESDLLSYSIVLLGATLSISTISEIGLNGVMFIVLQMTATIIGALYIGKKLGFAQNFRFLMASGNAVCGSSAIAATAPVIDADDNEEVLPFLPFHKHRPSVVASNDAPKLQYLLLLFIVHMFMPP